MSWTDKNSVKCIKYLRDKYDIKTFIETGAFKGINSRLHSKNFKTVMTCENHKYYYKQAKENLKDYENVVLVKADSPEFIKHIDIGNYIFYLDAHFYDSKLPIEDRFVVLKELDNMHKFKNCVIIVHDFDNGLGHITYDGISLDLDLMRSRLKEVNKNFYFYTNRIESCNPVKPEAKDIVEAGLEVDYDTLDNINYLWTSPRLSYRGLLYCLPTKLKEKELIKLGLREWN